MEDLDYFVNHLQTLLEQWDEMAEEARQQGVDQGEVYFHGVELGFELARDQLAQALADMMRLRATPNRNTFHYQ
jgi:hypothetical protein